jgi:hypothetical protein
MKSENEKQKKPTQGRFLFRTTILVIHIGNVSR